MEKLDNNREIRISNLIQNKPEETKSSDSLLFHALSTSKPSTDKSSVDNVDYSGEVPVPENPINAFNDGYGSFQIDENADPNSIFDELNGLEEKNPLPSEGIPNNTSTDKVKDRSASGRAFTPQQIQVLQKQAAVMIKGLTTIAWAVRMGYQLNYNQAANFNAQVAYLTIKMANICNSQGANINANSPPPTSGLNPAYNNAMNFFKIIAFDPNLADDDINHNQTLDYQDFSLRFVYGNGTQLGSAVTM